MLKVTFLTLIASLAMMMSVAVTAQAEGLPVPEGMTEICDFSGRIELTKSADIICLEENATVAPGTVIVTNGYELNLELVGNIDFADLLIVSFDENSVSENRAAAAVSIRAQSVAGQLTVRNYGRTASDLSGQIVTDYMTLACDFSQVLETDGFAQRWLNNQDYPAEFPLNRCAAP